VLSMFAQKTGLKINKDDRNSKQAVDERYGCSCLSKQPKCSLRNRNKAQ
jgi:hypothetical protein